MEYSPTNRGRELNLDRRETDQLCPTDEAAYATVLQLSTRGTVGLEAW